LPYSSEIFYQEIALPLPAAFPAFKAAICLKKPLCGRLLAGNPHEIWNNPPNKRRLA
jgi:hypothetical protein